MMMNTPSAKEKGKALDLALQQIEKQFGKGAIMKLGEESAQIAIETIPTGSIGLDMALHDVRFVDREEHLVPVEFH